MGACVERLFAAYCLLSIPGRAKHRTFHTSLDRTQASECRSVIRYALNSGAPLHNTTLTSTASQSRLDHTSPICTSLHAQHHRKVQLNASVLSPLGLCRQLDDHVALHSAS